MADRVRRWPALALDAAAVVAFAVIGRSSHDEGLTAAGVAGTAAPFLIGLAGGWAAAEALRHRSIVGPETTVGFGVTAAAGTVVGGLLLRRLAWGDGTALSFAVVTTVFVTAALLGWRAIGGSKVR